MADISIGYALHLLRYIGLDAQLPPRLADYLARLSARPAFQRAQAKQQVT
jgi:glutathione S-transferase